MEEVTNICKDLTFPDKEFIIRKYLLKYLHDGGLLKLDPDLITDVFNILNSDEIEIFKDQITQIIGDFDQEDFENIKWKINYCHNCSELGSVERCKNEHMEDCAYGEITSEEGCRNLFCHDCIYHLCSNENEECEAVRCEECSYV